MNTKRLITAAACATCAGLLLCSCATGTKASQAQEAQGAQNQMTRLNSLSDDELRSLAESGDAKAMMRLGTKYQVLAIDGVDETEAVRKAVYWWEKSAASGETMALTNLALLYAHKPVPAGSAAYGDIPLDYEKAFSYLNEAIEKGNMKAPRNLGEFYLNGEGVVKDEARAAGLFKLASERGDSTGTLYYADALAQGRGVAKDTEKARSLYQLLVDTNAHDAAAAKERLEHLN